MTSEQKAQCRTIIRKKVQRALLDNPQEIDLISQQCNLEISPNKSDENMAQMFSKFGKSEKQIIQLPPAIFAFNDCKINANLSVLGEMMAEVSNIFNQDITQSTGIVIFSATMGSVDDGKEQDDIDATAYLEAVAWKAIDMFLDIESKLDSEDFQSPKGWGF